YAFPLWQQVMQLQYWRSMLVDAGLSAGDIPVDWDGYWDFWCAPVQPAYRQRTGNRAYGLGLPMGVDASLSAIAFLTFLDAYNVRLVDDAGRLRVDDPAVRAGLIQAMTRYTQPYVRGCAPPSSRHWHDADSAVAFQNRTTVLVPTMTLASAPESLDDKDQAAPIATTRFPRKPDAGTLAYRASVKTGLVFKQARNKQDAKKFVSFLLDDAQLTPYVEAARGAWFPVMQAAQQRPFWQADPARTVVYRQFMAGTTAFEFTRNHRFTQLNHENVWARAMQRIVGDAVPVDQAVDEMIQRIKAVAQR
ncbi:MAG: ABC transporter substrate-binding protein, partial [Burkholderiaceae bacterium]